LIEDRRAQQEEAKKKEVEEQQRLFMEESLNEKRLVSRKLERQTSDMFFNVKMQFTFGILAMSLFFRLIKVPRTKQLDINSKRKKRLQMNCRGLAHQPRPIIDVLNTIEYCKLCISFVYLKEYYVNIGLLWGHMAKY